MAKEKKKKIVYIIDQLKNPAEYKLLSHIYGISYIQISLFSNYQHRDNILRKKFNDDNEISKVENNNEFFNEYLIDRNIYMKANEKLLNSNISEGYANEVLPDGSHRLLDKDMIDTDTVNFSKNKSGQRVSDIFHLSHYFINLDKDKMEIENEVDKFTALLFGNYRNYPTQDEFGMALAYHASYRSTFPNRRHVGACIISSLKGEVISVASVRAPTSTANTSIEHEDSIREGFENFKKQQDNFKTKLDNLKENLKLDDQVYEKITTYLDIQKLSKFVSDSIDFHPTTHAEIAALADAAKMGISVQGATLYTTTFPCHICAKDIITFGIQKVVYLEQYPKSKNAELYPKLISFDEEDTKKIPFIIFSGVSPRRYHYVYDLKNKPYNNNKKSNTSTTSENRSIPRLLEFEKPDYNKKREADIIKIFDQLIENTNNPYAQKDIKNDQLYTLLMGSDEELPEKN